MWIALQAATSTPDLAQKSADTGLVKGFNRAAAVEGDRPVSPIAYPWRPGLSQGAGCDLEQRLQRSAPTVGVDRAGPSPTGPIVIVRAGRRLACPTLARTRDRETAQGQHEVHTDPGRQPARPVLHCSRLFQHVIDELEG